MRDVTGMSRVADVANRLDIDHLSAVDILKRIGVADVRNYFSWVDAEAERNLVRYLEEHPEERVPRKPHIHGGVANPAILPTRKS